MAIDSVEDMKILFDGIPLDRMSVSMTMNGAVLPVMAMYVVAAEEQGVAPGALAGTVQNDILKEFMVRNTYIYPPEPSMRIVADVIEYTARAMPRFNPISISGYHMQEGGGDGGAGAGLHAGRRGRIRCATALRGGLDVDAFAPRLSFFFGIGMNFFMEVAKLRAARLLWAELVGALFQPSDPRSLMLRTHCQTSGVSLHQPGPVQQRGPYRGGGAGRHPGGHAVAAHQCVRRGAGPAHRGVGAHRAPTPSSSCARRRGLHGWWTRWRGRTTWESLTASLAAAARALIGEVEALGGMTKAVAAGMPKLRIEEAAARRQARMDRGEDVIVRGEPVCAGGRRRGRCGYPRHRQQRGA